MKRSDDDIAYLGCDPSRVLYLVECESVLEGTKTRESEQDSATLVSIRITEHACTVQQSCHTRADHPSHDVIQLFENPTISLSILFPHQAMHITYLNCPL